MPQKTTTARHRPHRMARIRERLARQLAVLAQHQDTDFTQTVNDLLIEALGRKRLWPPPPDQDD